MEGGYLKSALKVYALVFIGFNLNWNFIIYDYFALY